MTGPNHELEGQSQKENIEVAQVPIIEIQRQQLIEGTIDPDLKDDLEMWYGFTNKLASHEGILGYGVAKAEEPVVGTTFPIVNYIMREGLTPLDHRTAYQVTRDADNQLMEELKQINPHARTYDWYSHTDTENFDQHAQQLAHPEPVDRSTLSDAEKAVMDINSAMGGDDHEYLMFVKFI